MASQSPDHSPRTADPERRSPEKWSRTFVRIVPTAIFVAGVVAFLANGTELVSNLLTWFGNNNGGTTLGTPTTYGTFLSEGDSSLTTSSEPQSSTTREKADAESPSSTTATLVLADSLPLDADDVVEYGRGFAWGTPENEPALLNNVSYPRSIRWGQVTWQAEAWYEWSAGGFSRFCGIGGIDDEDSDGAALIELEVQVDGQVAFREITSLGKPVLIDAPFAPGIRLRLLSRGATSDNAHGEVVWANSTLTNGACEDGG